MTRDREGRHSDSQSRQGDLGALQKAGPHEANREEEAENKRDESTGNFRSPVVVREARRNWYRHLAECDANSTEQKKLSATKAAHGEQGDE